MELQRKAKEIKADEKWREAYMQSIQRDRDKFDAGVEQGESRREIKIVEKMIKRGDSTSEVIEVTDLSDQEIGKLREVMTRY